MTTAAQVQAAFAAANRGQTLDVATATGLATQIDGSGGTFTLNNYINQQFEANQNSTGNSLEIFSAIVGKTEATAADLTTVTNTVKSFLNLYSSQGVTVDRLPQAAADDLGAQLADNATGASFRSANNLTNLYGPNPIGTTATFDINGFATNWLTNVFGAAAVTPTAVQFEAQRFLELANRYKSLFPDANDTTGYVRAAGSLVAELVNQGEQANNGNYHPAALSFITADANGTANYGAALLAGGSSGGGGSGASTGVGGNIYLLTAGADIVPTTALPNTNDDFINGLTTANSLDNADNINGGNGLDILAANFNLNLATRANVQNVELQFYHTTAAAAIAIDTSLSTGLQQIWNENANAASIVNFTNLASSNGLVTPTVGIEGGGAGGSATVVALANGVTNATLNVALDNSVAGNNIQSTGVSVENLNLQIASGNALISNPDNTIGGAAPAAATNNSNLTVIADILSTINVKGAGALTLSLLGNSQATVTTVDASGLGALTNSKGLVFDASNSTAPTLTIIGSSSADTLKVATGQIVSVTGGGGADTITLGGAGTDKATIVYKTSTDSNGLGPDTLNKFDANNGAADKIDLKALGFTGPNAITTIATANNTNAGSDIAGLFTTAGSQAVFDPTAVGGATLYLDANHDGSYGATSDLAIKFTNLVGTLKVTDFILS